MSLRCIGELYASVISVSPAHGRNPTGYIIQVCIGVEKWFISKRYSEFREFWKSLIDTLEGNCACADRCHLLKGLELDAFPKKQSLKSFCMSQSVINARVEALNKILERMTLRLRTCSRSTLERCEIYGCPIRNVIASFLDIPHNMDVPNPKSEHCEKFSDKNVFLHTNSTPHFHETRQRHKKSYHQHRNSINFSQQNPFVVSSSYANATRKSLQRRHSFIDLSLSSNAKSPQVSKKMLLHSPQNKVVQSSHPSSHRRHSVSTRSPNDPFLKNKDNHNARKSNLSHRNSLVSLDSNTDQFQKLKDNYTSSHRQFDAELYEKLDKYLSKNHFAHPDTKNNLLDLGYVNYYYESSAPDMSPSKEHQTRHDRENWLNYTDFLISKPYHHSTTTTAPTYTA